MFYQKKRMDYLTGHCQIPIFAGIKHNRTTLYMDKRQLRKGIITNQSMNHNESIQSLWTAVRLTVVD